MDKVRQRIDDIYKEKEGLQKEFEELQNNCPHDLYKIGLFSWHVGNISTSRLCIHCDKYLGHASDIEDAKFTEEQVNGMGKTVYSSTKEK